MSHGLSNKSVAVDSKKLQKLHILTPLRLAFLTWLLDLIELNLSLRRFNECDKLPDLGIQLFLNKTILFIPIYIVIDNVCKPGNVLLLMISRPPAYVSVTCHS